MPLKTAILLNNLWHSRLPELTNWQACKAFGAFYCNIYYAVAIWGPPIARAFNNKGYYELRRMAIAGNAPKNTASRMLKIMRKQIVKNDKTANKLISYQDTEVHCGTIYKASGWRPIIANKQSSWDRPNIGRRRISNQATGKKIRWEYELKKNPEDV